MIAGFARSLNCAASAARVLLAGAFLIAIPSISPVHADSPDKSLRSTYPCLSPEVWNAPPPPTFNPLTAMATQLECYGFPPRPDRSDTVALSQWTRIVSSTTYAYVDPAKVVISPVPATPPTIQNPASGITPFSVPNEHDDIWSGYVLSTPNNRSSTQAWGQWQQPNYVSNPSWIGLGNELTTWVGISNNGGSRPLFQAGSYYTEGCQSGHSCNTNTSPPNPGVGVFFEDPAIIGEMRPGAPAISANDTIFTEVWLTNNNQTGNFFIQDATTNQSHTYQLTDTGGQAGSAVIWASEDSLAQGNSSLYINYNTVRWFGASYWNGSAWVPLSQIYGSTEYHVMTGIPSTGRHMAPTYPPAYPGSFNNCPAQYLSTLPPTCS